MTRSPTPPLPPPKERRRLREAGSLTQGQLAARLGVSRETMRAWESGRTTPRGRRGEAYARLLVSFTRPADEEDTEVTARQPPVADDGGVVAEAREDSGGVVAEVREDSGPVTAEVRREAPGSVAAEARVEGAGGVVAEAREDSGAVVAEVRREAPGSVAAEAREDSGGVVAEVREDSGPVTAEVRREAPGSVAAEAREGSGPVAAEVRREAPGSVVAEARVEGAGSAGPLTPTQAFDALYAFCAPALVRQTYLLSGRRELAREAVERAFQLAWDRWPEVAVDPDPAGWVRAAAYEYALSPWHHFRPRYRHPEPPPADARDRALLDTLLTLPPPYRRTLVLHDGVGLRLPETAAETEASTSAAARRLVHAREAVAARLPELSDPTALGRRLAELASSERLRAARPTVVRAGSERRARFWTRAAIAFTVAIIGATALTARTAPTHYEPPVAPGETVRGLPPKSAPGPLSQAELRLRAKLRREAANGPERLLPAAR
ncbi:sigma factor-like helix-turn-helix DNA-binding protein [Streptomyces sp. NPDC006458]|uniref:sigma factor-like helix-turn-helix DNA-binding protein n=1 Tax=Streptomyces sp. NPDC006458 TaxID=3154302 RepID=UPI0033A7EB04